MGVIWDFTAAIVVSGVSVALVAIILTVVECIHCLFIIRDYLLAEHGDI